MAKVNKEEQARREGMAYARIICDKISRKIPNATTTYTIEDGELLCFITIINLIAENITM